MNNDVKLPFGGDVRTEEATQELTGEGARVIIIENQNKAIYALLCVFLEYFHIERNQQDHHGH
ncbi:hypothetical protein [Paenibacillus senegalimassiliensis]|uniref:hypothetical protein n=1 Tax=Paenibacillus senegalimassiliensis TaxID=1737426 RepID=UPI00073E7DEE|nr:hypothetical protein [Paenibacillus senegalimassiliensis]